jgi:hypothetical protein
MDRTKQTKLTVNSGRVTIYIHNAIEHGHVPMELMKLTVIQLQNATLIIMNVYHSQRSKLYVYQWIKLEMEKLIVLEQLTKESTADVCTLKIF